MVLFLRFSLAYFCVALLIILTTRSNGLEPLYFTLHQGVMIAPDLAKVIGVAIVLVMALSLLARDRKRMGETLTLVAFGAVATILFHISFALIKTSLPYMVPFYADPFWARLDQSLHGGTAPWVYAHKIAALLPFDVKKSFPLYLEYWAIPALYLPVLMAAFDRDQNRVGRMITLYLVVWVLIGNVMALAGMSAGPIFYDRLYGGDTFAGLHQALVANGVNDTMVGRVQDGLWHLYSEQLQAFGSGISAFPSVHVGAILVGAIYLWERSKWLLPIGLAYVIVILFLSIYTGYHYAIDGYISILVVMLSWRFLLWRERQA